MLLDNYYYMMNSIQMNSIRSLSAEQPEYHQLFCTAPDGTKNRLYENISSGFGFRLDMITDNILVEPFTERSIGSNTNKQDFLILGSGSNIPQSTDITMGSPLQYTDGSKVPRDGIQRVQIRFRESVPVYNPTDKSFTCINEVTFRNTSTTKTIKLREWGIERLGERSSGSYYYYGNMLVREVLDEDILIEPEESVKMTITVKFYLPD